MSVQDGSGSIAYDEIESMVRDFGCEIEGRDSSALLLDKFTGGKGAMSYMEFITKVIGLQPDALKSDPNSSCPPTPQIVETVSDQVKKQLFNSPGGRNKLLSVSNTHPRSHADSVFFILTWLFSCILIAGATDFWQAGREHSI